MVTRQYIQGETIAFSLTDGGWANAVLKVGADSYLLTKADGNWSCTIATDAIAGQYRYAAIADGSVRESGVIIVKPLVSRYREVIEAIDSALQGVAKNGKYTVTVGEISLQDKTFDELVKAKNYYSRLADGEENGVAPSFGPRRVSEVY